jgi:hypothetical protein
MTRQNAHLPHLALLLGHLVGLALGWRGTTPARASGA